MTPFKYIFFFIVLGFISCNDSKPKNAFIQEREEIQRLYNRSQGNDLEISEKLLFIDSALALTKSYPTDSLTLEIIYQKSNIHYSAKQIDSTFYYDKKLLRKSNELNHHYFKGKASQALAYYYKTKQVYDSAYFYYNVSKNSFQNLKDSSQVGRRLLVMGQIQQNQSDYFGSKETITEALQYLLPEKDNKYIASSYNSLATNHRKLFNYTDAIAYHVKAIETTLSKKDKPLYKNSLAATHIENKQIPAAHALLATIVKDSFVVTNKKEYPRILDNLVYVQWLSGNTTTEEAFQKPLELRKRNNDQRGQIASYTHLGEFYSKANPRKATIYFDSVIQLSKTLKMPRAEKDALKFLMQLQPQNINLRDRYVHLQDSLYAQELKVKTQFAKYKYDDKLKQESILRLEKENAEKELEASQQRNQKIIYLGGFLFITTVLGLSVYGFRQRTKRLKQKNKTEKLKAIHETEAELSRKLHDDHGGKLNKVMSLIQRDADKGLILDTVEDIYNHTRDFSRELNSVNTGPDFWKGLKATLEFTKPTEVDLIFDGGKEINWAVVSHQIKTILFKALQELIINMAKHSKASQTVILFKDQNQELSIYYEDNGVGASKESLLRKNGLQNTEKRIQAVGGSITFDSEEGKGFRAEIRIPK